jgi:hypothetical protein
MDGWLGKIYEGRVEGIVWGDMGYKGILDSKLARVGLKMESEE